MDITKQLQAGTSGLDIIHGELKNLMLETETDLADMLQGEGYEYLQGVLDAYTKVYQLTYDISFTLSDLTNQQANAKLK